MAKNINAKHDLSWIEGPAKMKTSDTQAKATDAMLTKIVKEGSASGPTRRRSLSRVETVQLARRIKLHQLAQQHFAGGAPQCGQGLHEGATSSPRMERASAVARSLFAAPCPGSERGELRNPVSPLDRPPAVRPRGPPRGFPGHGDQLDGDGIVPPHCALSELHVDSRRNDAADVPDLREERHTSTFGRAFEEPTSPASQSSGAAAALGDALAAAARGSTRETKPVQTVKLTRAPKTRNWSGAVPILGADQHKQLHFLRRRPSRSALVQK